MLFATSRVYGENVLKIKRGDLLFLLNLDTNTLYGTFLAQIKQVTHVAYACNPAFVQTTGRL
jgi:hypothetical protein